MQRKVVGKAEAGDTCRPPASNVADDLALRWLPTDVIRRWWRRVLRLRDRALRRCILDPRCRAGAVRRGRVRGWGVLRLGWRDIGRRRRHNLCGGCRGRGALLIGIISGARLALELADAAAKRTADIPELARSEE